MEFLPLSRRRSSSRNVSGGEERGETDVFAGYSVEGILLISLLQHNPLGNKNVEKCLE